MSDEKTSLVRPRQVTTAALLAAVGSVVLVLSLFDTLGRLRSADTRSEIDDILSGGAGATLGLDTGQVVDILRVLSLVSGAMAAAALVCAVFVFQRHRGARLALTVVTALLVLTVPVAGIMPLLLVAAVFMVWSRPARDWFDGRQPTPTPAPAGAREGLREAPRSAVHDSGRVLSEQGPPPSPYPFGQRPEPGQPGQPDQQPPSTSAYPTTPPPSGQDPYGQGGQQGQPYGQPHGPQPGQQQGQQQGQQYGQPYGQQPGQQYGQPYQQPYQQPGQQYGQPYGQQYDPYSQYGGYGQPYAQHTPPGRDPDKRPGTVTAAAIVTWIGAGGVLAVMVLLAFVLGTASDRFFEEFDRAARQSDLTVTHSDLLAIGWGAVVVCTIWCISAIVLAFFALRRSRPARIALVVSSVMVVLLSMLMILSGFTIITLILGVVVAVLLFTGGANEWYSRTPSSGGYPNAYAGYGGTYADPYQQQGPPSYPQQPQQPYGEQPQQPYGEQPQQPYGEQPQQPYGEQPQDAPQPPADQGEQRPTYPPPDEEHKGPW